jgi:hypothetical protein
MDFHFENIPGILISLIHITLSILSLRLIRANKIFKIFFIWMAINSLWTLSGALYWILHNSIFDYAMGILLAFSPVCIFVFSYTYLKGNTPKVIYLLFLLPALIWIPAQLSGTSKVSGKQFGEIQMPFMILFDILAGIVLYACCKIKANELSISQDKYHSAALLLLGINLPTVLFAGTSYYLTYFIIDVPSFLPWLGDLFIGLSSILNFIILNSITHL